MNPLICCDTPGTAETADPDGFEQACKNAHDLAEALGDGWAGVVWENLGWHFRATSPCGRVDVYPGSVEGYSAMLHEPWTTGMHTYLGEPGRGERPQQAVADLLEGVRARVRHINSLLEGL